MIHALAFASPDSVWSRVNSAHPKLDEIVATHLDFIWRVLRLRGVRDADVEDVAQEVLLAVHRALPSFEGRSSIRTWLYGICLRVSSKHRRKPYVRREIASASLPEEEGTAPQLMEVARSQARHKLNEILAGLDDDKRTVFVLYEIEEVPMAEIAEILGCPLQTAYSRLHAARAKVLERYDRDSATRDTPRTGP